MAGKGHGSGGSGGSSSGGGRGGGGGSSSPKLHNLRQIIIEDVDLATWMTMNNTFRAENRAVDEEPWDPDQHHWDGLLIQIGQFREVGSIFQAVSFEQGSHVRKTITSVTPFFWINLVGEDEGRDEPMTSDHVGYLWPDPGTDTPCKAIDEMPGIDARCIRKRSLHGHFTPQSIITLWHGLGGYDIEVQYPHFDKHVEHIIKPKEKIQIFIDGAPYNAHSISTIRISRISAGGIHHSGQHSPPWLT